MFEALKQMDADERDSWQEEGVGPANSAEMQNWPPVSKAVERRPPSQLTGFEEKLPRKAQSIPLEEGPVHRSDPTMSDDTPLGIGEVHARKAYESLTGQSGKQNVSLAVPWLHEAELDCGNSSASSSLDIAFIDSQGPGLNVDLDWEACCDDSDGGESERGAAQRFFRGMGPPVVDDNTAGCGHQSVEDGWFEKGIANGANEGVEDSLEEEGKGEGVLKSGCSGRAVHKSVDIRDADWWRDVPIDLSDWPDSRRYACHEKYEVLERIGEGTFGAVYKAKRKEDGTIVALKKCFKRRLVMGQVENLMREVHALERVDHPNVVSDVGFGLGFGLVLRV